MDDYRDRALNCWLVRICNLTISQEIFLVSKCSRPLPRTDNSAIGR